MMYASNPSQSCRILPDAAGSILPAILPTPCIYMGGQDGKEWGERLSITSLTWEGWGYNLGEMARRPLPIKPGDRFGLLTAITEAAPKYDKYWNVMWVFRCDCGEEVTWRVSTASYNARNSQGRAGFGGCPACYFANKAAAE